MPRRRSRSQKVQRRPLRDVEQLRVPVTTLDFGVDVGEWRLEFVRHVLVELVVLLLRDVRLRSRRKRRRLVDLLVLVSDDLLLGRGVPRLFPHENGHGDMVGGTGEGFRVKPDTGEQVVLLRPEMKDDVGSASPAGHGFDGVVTFARALPSDAVLRRETGPPGHQAATRSATMKDE